jgi:ribosome-associated toxin RatA of RatAB toxin-antitoxin module
VIFIRSLFIIQALFIGNYSFAQTISSQKIEIKVDRVNSLFEVQVDMRLPINECKAYLFLTNYEDAKYISGIKESKIIERKDNKVIVERVVEERILFIPIHLHSLITYTEIPGKAIYFSQIKGDAKKYEGAWTINPGDNGLTHIRYESKFELETSVPLFLIEYFMKKSATSRFEALVDRMLRRNYERDQECH